MGNHRAQASKNSVTAKQEVKPSLSNVRRSLSGLPENYLSRGIADSYDKQIAVSQGSGFFDYGSIPIFPKSKTTVGLNSQALPIQAKLKIGQPNDKYEQEADRVADQVMRMPDPKLQRQPENEAEEVTLQPKPLAGQISPLIQRQAEPDEEEELIQPGYDQEPEEPMPILESVPTGNADELDDEKEEFIQLKSNADTAPQVTLGIAHAIHSIKGAGQPLPASERAFFEPRFGRDFGNVRVYSDSRAALTAQSINARAFTLGRDIVFGAEQYSPGSRKGRSLLAHELTHIVQQGGGRTSSKAQHRGSIESDPIDHAIDQNLLMRQPDLIEPAQETGDAVQIVETQLTDSETSVMVKAMFHRESLRRGLIKLEKQKLYNELYGEKIDYKDPDVRLADNVQRLQRFDRRLKKLERNWRIAARKKLSIMLQGLRQLKQPGGTLGYMAYLNLIKGGKQNPESALIWMQVGNMLWSLGKKTTPSLRGPGYRKINYPRR